MPPLFDQYKSMDRGLIKKFSDGGGKETIRITLREAVKEEKSREATVLLIRDLLYFKVAQARDKKNTEVPERMLASLPMRIASVNSIRSKIKILPDYTRLDLPHDLNESYLRAFIANSSYVFQKEIPATFKALLAEILGGGRDFPNVKNLLVDSYTAKFLLDNNLINEGDVRNARNVTFGERKRPNALQVKELIVQILDIYKFHTCLKSAPKEFSRIILDVTKDEARYITGKVTSGFGKDKQWLNNVFKCHEFIDEAQKRGKLIDAKEATGLGAYKEMRSVLAGRKSYMALFPKAKTNWLVYFSLLQLHSLAANRLHGYFYRRWEATRNGELDTDPHSFDKLQCALPGGWEDWRHIYVIVRYTSPTSYDSVKQSFNYLLVYQLFWVENPVERSGDSGVILEQEILEPGIVNGKSQVICWVTITVKFKYSFPPITFDSIPSYIDFEGMDPHYEVEVFDSKPEYPRIKWPSLF